MTGEPVITWQQMTAADWDLTMSMLREHDPGAEHPGFEIGDWRVDAWARTTRPYP